MTGTSSGEGRKSTTPSITGWTPWLWSDVPAKVGWIFPAIAPLRSAALSWAAVTGLPSSAAESTSSENSLAASISCSR